MSLPPASHLTFVLLEKLPIVHIAQDGRRCELYSTNMGQYGVRLALSTGGGGGYLIGTYSDPDHMERALYHEGVQLEASTIGARFFGHLTLLGKAAQR